MNLLKAGFAVLLFAGANDFTLLADDLEDTYQRLKDAEVKKDPELVKKSATELSALIRKEASKPAPEDMDKETWAKRLTYLKDMETQTEYALCFTALQAQPAATVDLISTLEQLNPKSKYLDDAYGLYFLALNQTGAASKIPAVAQKALQNFPDNEDALLVLADSAMKRKQTDGAQSYAERLLAVMANHPKPAGMSAADWERKKAAALTRGYWIAGMMHAEKAQYFDADKDLRAALPLVKGNDAMLGPALFYLGVCNYQLGKTLMKKPQVLEAAKFSEQAAAIKGPYAEQAWRNATIMKTEAGKMR